MLKYVEINILDITVEHLDITIEHIRWLSYSLTSIFLHVIILDVQIWDRNLKVLRFNIYQKHQVTHLIKKII